jgi:hypothetical protein
MTLINTTAALCRWAIERTKGAMALERSEKSTGNKIRWIVI